MRMPGVLYVLLALISFFFLMTPLRQIIPGSTGPVFTSFSPYSKYLIVDYSSDRLFSIAQGPLPWQQILGSNIFATRRYASAIMSVCHNWVFYIKTANHSVNGNRKNSLLFGSLKGPYKIVNGNRW